MTASDTVERRAVRSEPAPQPAVEPVSTGLVLAMGSMIALAPLTIDTYLPALPAIQDDLETTASAVQLTLTGTLIGLAVGQLVIGPLSDQLGRRRPLLAGAALHVLSSLLIALAPSIAVLGALRMLQGFGAAAATVVTMAMVRDVASGRAAATLLSRLMLVMGAAPILAPTIGSQVLRWTSWHGIFVVLAAIGAVLLVLGVAYLPETLPPAGRRRGGIAGTGRGYALLLRDPGYLGLVLVMGLTMGSLFAYVAGGSFVFQEQYGLSEQQFGYAFGLGSIALIGATQLNPRLLNRYQPQQVLTAGLSLGVAGGIALLIAGSTGAGGLPGLMVPIAALLAGAGLTFPNTPALALSRHPEDVAGSAAAVLGAVQFGIGALTPPLVGLLGSDAVAMASVMLGAMALALLVLLVPVRPAGRQRSTAVEVPEMRTESRVTAVPVDA